MAQITTAQTGDYNVGSTWTGGVVPSSTDTPVIQSGHTVTLKDNRTCSGMIVNGTFQTDPNLSVKLISNAIYSGTTPLWTGTTGNIIVQNSGIFKMRPVDATKNHETQFTGVLMDRYQGLGMDPKDSDIGLWVVGGGKLDIEGAAKTAWTRVTSSANQTATSVIVEDAVGWRATDKIVVCPTAKNDFTNFEERDINTVTGSGPYTANFTGGLGVNHPEITWPAEWVSDEEWAGHTPVRAEVLNLTRNVVISGETAGRAHIFIHNTSPVVHTLKNFVVKWMGPTKDDATKSDAQWRNVFIGRWPLHFHHSMDNNNGTVVDGVVTWQTDAHAYVPHNSDNISFLNCIAYDGSEDAFWWDKQIPGTTDGITFGTLYDNCISAKLTAVTYDHKGALRHFAMGNTGTVLGGATIRNCTAVGLYGSSMLDTTCGFGWLEKTGDGGVWLFKDNIAHNNIKDGMFWWVNTQRPDVMLRFLSVRNGSNGTENGAYQTIIDFVDCAFYDNGTETAIKQHATSRPTAQDPTVPGVGRFLRCFIDAPAGFGLKQPKHTAATISPIVFDTCRFRKASDNVVIQYIENEGPNNEEQPSYTIFTACKVNGLDLLYPEYFQLDYRADGTVIQVGSQAAVQTVFTWPNHADLSTDNKALARVYQTDADILVAGGSGTGVVSGMAVSAAGGMQLAVAAGQTKHGTSYKDFGTQNITITPAHLTLDRLDLIYISSAGVLSQLNGIPATPLLVEAPDLPAGAVALKLVLVKDAVTSIADTDMVDKRYVLGLSPPVATPKLGGGGSLQHLIPGVPFVSTSTTAYGIDTIFYFPIYVEYPTKFTQLRGCIESAAAASSVAKLGIYSVVPSTGQPDALVTEAPAIAIDTTGVKTFDITDVILHGHYLIAMTCNGQATWRTFRGGGLAGITDSITTGSASVFNVKLKVTRVYDGTLPFPAVEWDNKDVSSVPFDYPILIR